MLIIAFTLVGLSVTADLTGIGAGAVVVQMKAHNPFGHAGLFRVERR
ncbi:MAG: hypothetical protein QMD09_11855 [Desulfatibacillaceae bacterium]|nr:hypothetical protein [Desulfatibacillaceae bacterium]